MSTETVVHRAKWVVTGTCPPIEDGAVQACGGTIEAVGRFSEVRRNAPAGTRTIDHGSNALVPGLVNAHTHLEWTSMEGRIPFPQTGFPAWLQVFNRARTDLSVTDRDAAVAAGRERLRDGATALWGNTGGIPASPGRMEPVLTGEASTRGPQASPGNGEHEQSFFEVLGFNESDLSRVAPPELIAAAARPPETPPGTSLAAHACYSTSADLIRQAKAWTRERDLPFSIHTAEHLEEIELLRSGTGFFRNFLESIGRWAPAWEPPAASPVITLDRLGVLDRKTLLVHAVHMTEADWDLVAKRGCAVCFCPRSNAAINVGRPDIATALVRNIPAALGTDSLASNGDLNMFREAAYVLDTYPSLTPDQVLRMATSAGAAALGFAHRFGTLARGRSGRFLNVTMPRQVTARHHIETIIAQGAAGKWQWTHA